MHSRTRGRLVAAMGLTAALVSVSAGSTLAGPPGDFFCVANDGWDRAPSVGIDTDSQPTLGGINGSLLVSDAIVEYWNDSVSPGPDGVADNGADSAFSTSNGGYGFSAPIVNANPGDQDIDITFTDSLPAGVLGRATCIVNSGVIVSATIELINDDATLSAEEYKNVAAHELGHTIGLQHKGRPGTMMHKFFFHGLDAYLPLSKASKKWLDRNY